MSTEKQVSYQATNTYSILNDFTPKTKNVWVLCHGIGYLSRYFLRYFQNFNAEENYFIVPQAPSKYYQNNNFKHVGASWLTRENTEAEIENVLNYLDEVYKAENLSEAPNLIIFGYSQGVSVATRWVARRKIECNQLIMHSGKVPQELGKNEFYFLKNTRFSFIYGTADEYLDKSTIEVEEKRLNNLFPQNFEIIPFDGKHEVNSEVVSKLI